MENIMFKTSRHNRGPTTASAKGSEFTNNQFFALTDPAAWTGADGEQRKETTMDSNGESIN